MTTGRINQVTTFTVARSKPQATVKHVAAVARAVLGTSSKPEPSQFPQANFHHTSSSDTVRERPGQFSGHVADPSITIPSHISLPSLLVLLYQPQAKLRTLNSREFPAPAPNMTRRPQKACKHFQRSLTNTRTTTKSSSKHYCKLPTAEPKLRRPLRS